MRGSSVWRAIFAALVMALGSCAPSPQPAGRVAENAATCRVGPDGGPSLADRGIGGTGSPAARIADRGIGGTGIVGVITGFGSVCVNGFEVRYDPVSPVSVDGRPEGAEALRVGQLAAIEAAGPAGDLTATRLAIRHEVTGPVEDVADGGATLRIAGQSVAVSAGIAGDALVRPGDWVAVSGLRSLGGRVFASRLDARTPGRAIIHGRLEREASGAWRIEGARIEPPAAANLVAGRLVQASGTYAGGVLRASSVEPDVLAADPAAYFGEAVARLSVEQFVSPAEGGVRLGDVTVAVPGSAGVLPGGSGPAIVDFTREAGGRLSGVALRPAPVAGGTALPSGPGAGGPAFGAAPTGGPDNAGRGFTPAPMPGSSAMPGTPAGAGAVPPGLLNGVRPPFPPNRAAMPGGGGPGASSPPPFR